MGKTGPTMDETLAEIGQNFPRVALTLCTRKWFVQYRLLTRKLMLSV